MLSKILISAVFWMGASAQAASAAPKVLVARWAGPITPVSSEFMLSALDAAQERGDEVLVLELDTPGGLDGAMRETVKAIMASKVPVIVHVAPSGARAASAGVFIAMSAHVAVMAPGTNIGAAHPVQLGGAAGRSGGGEAKKSDPVMEEKLANDAAAYLSAIAERRGRNADWARFVVHKSSSLAASEAVRLRIVDFVAADLDELLSRSHGLKLAGFPRPLRLKGAVIERFEPTARQKFLMMVVDPNVAMLLMTLGVSGMLIELYHPGLVLPGVVGVLSLLLALYAFQTLSANMAGVLLMLAGMIFLILEINVVSYGLLALSGIAAIFFGATLMFHDATGLSIAWNVLVGALGGLVLVFGAVAYIVAKAFSRGPRSGAATMVGRAVTASTALSPRGSVGFGSEIWRAESLDGPHPAGTELMVVEIRDLTLFVRRP
ncbi:MAG: hypothetical protein A2506_07815 [Elusimicrobia bacterium RIFOXYD12_FULL_66_9]|nr:MAG: hypothetical protein A2506_07815 [Elusimicrobia bacterium RIFOXYD12_FULL_66_9]